MVEMFPTIRMRRYRKNEILRRFFKEVYVSTYDLIYPIFIKEGLERKEEIKTMPGIYRMSLNELNKEVEELLELDIRSIILFGIPKHKDSIGSEAFNKNGIVQKAVRQLKENFGDELIVITDVCLCQYTDHGHCGIIKDGKILNDKTLEILSKIALSHAEAGCDIVAPSDMMDGRVKKIRETLDENGYEDVMIMSYAAKFASSFYSPFRDAAYSKPKFGDRKTHQLDYATIKQALREVELDIKEGADIVMIKPALAYMDIISKVKEKFNVPVAAFNVSGEYSMVKAASILGMIDEKQIVKEILTCIKRAGADLIITYHAKNFARWIKEGDDIR